MAFDKILILIFVAAISNPAMGQDVKQSTLDIDWAEAKRQAAQDLERNKGGVDIFRASAPEDLSNVDVPVLVVGTGPVRAAVRVRAQGSSYIAYYPLDKDATMSIMGSSDAVALPSDEAVASLDLQDTGSGSFSVLDGESSENPDELGGSGQEADFSFIKFGAAYTIRLSCNEESDARCTESTYARGVAKDLILVGGKNL